MKLDNLNKNDLEKFTLIISQKKVKEFQQVERISLKLINKYKRISKYHNKFKYIFLYDFSITNYLNWKLLLDEILRFFHKNGKLVIHIMNGKYSSIWGIKSFLSDKVNFKLNFVNQINLTSDKCKVEFNLGRKIYLSRDWTVGIPSNGNRNSQIYNLIKSIEKARKYYISKYKKNMNVQIIIIGPEHKIFNKFNVEFYDPNPKTNLSFLGKKKNLIVKKSKYENILLIHDRYTLNYNFFASFEKWGFDFDFCTINQYDTKGRIYDPLLYMDEIDKKNMQMYRIYRSFEDFNNLYINGGLIIGKKNIFKKINFNPCLLQNEAEDIELAIRLLYRGIVARLNSYTCAVTTTLTKGSNLTPVPYKSKKELIK